MNRNLSIVVPALNEEKFIQKTVLEILEISRQLLDNFEVILINDGSVDHTPQIMNELANSCPEVMVLHHSSAKGVGVAFWEGIDRAKYENLSLIPGDNAYNIEGLKTLFDAIGSAELIVTYRQNATHARSKFRIILSKLFRFFVIILSGHRLKDFYSAEIYPVKYLRELKVRPVGYTYQIEALVSLLARGVTFIELPTMLNNGEHKNSQVLKWKTVVEVVKLYWRLLVHKAD